MSAELFLPWLIIIFCALTSLMPSSEFYPLAEKYMQGKPSAILSFGLKDGYEAGVRFYDALQIFKRASLSALNG